MEKRIVGKGVAELLLTKALQRTGGAFLFISAKPSGVCIFIESVEHKRVALLAFRLSFGGTVFGNFRVCLE
ncbi:hypothetical protein MXD62_09530, partial [Frankia sp. Mgl5]|nr:hypothetical protein [Frankia sp. Mgl5]